MVDFKKTKLTFGAVEKTKDLQKQGEDKFFKVGMYDCVIKEAVLETKGKAPADSTWKKLKIVIEGSGGKTKFHWIEYPTERQEYIVDGKDRWFMFLKFQAFAMATGCSADTDVGEFITEVMEDPAKLVGRQIRVRFGYSRGYYAKFCGSKDVKEYQLVNAKDEKALDEKFPSFEACEAYCMQKGLTYAAFPEPVELLPPDPATAKAISAKVVEKKKEKKVELPF